MRFQDLEGAKLSMHDRLQQTLRELCATSEQMLAMKKEVSSLSLMKTLCGCAMAMIHGESDLALWDFSSLKLGLFCLYGVGYLAYFHSLTLQKALKACG